MEGMGSFCGQSFMECYCLQHKGDDSSHGEVNLMTMSFLKKFNPIKRESYGLKWKFEAKNYGKTGKNEQYET